MRSSLYFLGALGAGLTFAAAQNVIPNNSRPVPAAPVAPLPEARGANRLVPQDSRLGPGDFVSVLIEEDKEKPWELYVTDTGHVDLSRLGAVKVAGRTATEAASFVGIHLREKYYHKATVRFQIIRKAEGSLPALKVTVDGKISRPGRQSFNESDPITLSEAVTNAVYSMYSDVARVRLTRGGQTTTHDVGAIIKKGRSELDIRLQDGDRIYVPEKSGWIVSGK
jgi:protein involved in polysaccharide export with SLBB domain